MEFDGARLRQRLIYLNTPINKETATRIVAELLFCDREKPGDEISLIINSIGGVVYAMLAIHDTMQKIQSPVSTLGVQYLGGAATILLMAGEPGRRHVTETCRIGLIPNVQQQQDQPVLASEPADELLSQMLSFVVKYTKLSSTDDYISLASRPQPWLTAEEALRFGFADHIKKSEP